MSDDELRMTVDGAKGWIALGPDWYCCNDCDVMKRAAERGADSLARLAWSMREVIRWRAVEETLIGWVRWNVLVWAFAVRLELIDVEISSDRLFSHHLPKHYADAVSLADHLIVSEVIDQRWDGEELCYEYRLVGP